MRECEVRYAQYLGIRCLRMIICMMWMVKVVVVEVMDHDMVFWDWISYIIVQVGIFANLELFWEIM